MTESSRARTILYRSLTTIPHRKLDQIVPAFREGLETDPDFTSRAFVYLTLGGTKIRDQQEAAVIALLQADPAYPEFREAGRVLLLGRSVYRTDPPDIPGLEPYRILRVDRFVRSSKNKIPRLMRGIAGDYARALEANPVWFDSVAMLNRKTLKSLYRHYHVVPSARAQAILFDERPPSDSKFAALKEIAKESDPVAAARLVIEHKIPYRVATSILPKISPAAAVALVEAMSPTEALNSRGWVEQSGVLEMAEVKAAYLAKVKRATRSVASAEHRRSAQGGDAEIQAAVNEAKESAVRESPRISGDVLILVDKSSSMERAIEVAQEVGYRIASAAEGNISVVAFNDYGQEIKVKGSALEDWQRAFRLIRADGWTSIQAGFDLALKNGFLPQKVVLITDGGENRGDFSRALVNYSTQTGISPHIAYLRVPGHASDTASARLESTGLRMDRFDVSGEDYLIYDQVVHVLGGPVAKSLVEVILETELPRRVK